MEMLIIDQRNIQKKGGRAARYPYSYALYIFLKRYFNIKNIVIWDCTYGQGRFYAAWRERETVVTHWQ